MSPLHSQSISLDRESQLILDGDNSHTNTFNNLKLKKRKKNHGKNHDIAELQQTTDNTVNPNHEPIDNNNVIKKSQPFTAAENTRSSSNNNNVNNLDEPSSNLNFYK